MDSYNLVSYAYTNNEIKRIFFISNYMNLIIFILLSVNYVVLVIKNNLFTDTNSIIAAIFITILFISFSTYCFIKLYKSIQNLKATQKIYIVDDLFYYENGRKLYKVNKKYISKIKELKNFYVLKIAYNKFEEEYDYPILPYIPRFVISKEEIQSLAHELNIKFTERRN